MVALASPYNRENPEHLSRGNVFLPDRTKVVRGGFAKVGDRYFLPKTLTIDKDITKDTVVETAHFTTTPYTRLVTEPSQLKNFEVEHFAHHGEGAAGPWLQDAYGNTMPGFVQVCTIVEVLSPLSAILTPRDGAGGTRYVEVAFKIRVTYGANSLSAKLLWTENVRATRLFSSPAPLLTFGPFEI